MFFTIHIFMNVLEDLLCFQRAYRFSATSKKVFSIGIPSMQILWRKQHKINLDFVGIYNVNSYPSPSDSKGIKPKHKWAVGSPCSFTGRSTMGTCLDGIRGEWRTLSPKVSHGPVSLFIPLPFQLCLIEISRQLEPVFTWFLTSERMTAKRCSLTEFCLLAMYMQTQGTFCVRAAQVPVVGGAAVATSLVPGGPG